MDDNGPLDYGLRNIRSLIVILKPTAILQLAWIFYQKLRAKQPTLANTKYNVRIISSMKFGDIYSKRN